MLNIYYLEGGLAVGEMCWLGYKVYFTSALTTMSLFAP